MTKSLLIAAALLVASCGGGDDETSDAGATPTGGSAAATAPSADDPPVEMNSEALTVTSDDGLAELHVPSGAVPADVEISVSRVEPAELGAEEDAVLAAYALEPDGLIFETPATLSVREPAGEEGGIEVRSAFLINDDEAEAVMMRALRDGDEIVHLSRIDHFSTFVQVAAGLRVAVRPAMVDGLDVGDSFEAAVTATEITTDAEVGGGRAVHLNEWQSIGALDEPEGENPSQSEESPAYYSWVVGPTSAQMWSTLTEPSELDERRSFTCHATGPGTYRARVLVGLNFSVEDDDGTVQHRPALPFLGIAVGGQASVLVDVDGTASCTGSLDESEPDDATDIEDPPVTDAPADEPNDSTDEEPAGDGPAIAVVDPIGDLTDFSGNSVAAGILPEQWDLTEVSIFNSTFSATLAAECDESCLVQMQIASCQMIVRRSDGGIEATATLQKNDQGGFDLSTTGNPALDIHDADYSGRACTFDFDGAGLPEGSTLEARVGGSRTDRADEGAEDWAGPIANWGG